MSGAGSNERGLDPQRWVTDHGDYLFRYALLRTRNRDLAEDLVQETFLAALKAQERFEGRSTERTWLVGILKHKLLDHLRKSNREQPTDELDARGIDELYDGAGRWQVKPARWRTDPHEAMKQQAFRDVLELCLGQTPERLATAFVLREVDGLSGEEIGKVLEVTTTNLWVMLYRARMRLRKCIEENWMKDEAP